MGLDPVLFDRSQVALDVGSDIFVCFVGSQVERLSTEQPRLSALFFVSEGVDKEGQRIR